MATSGSYDNILSDTVGQIIRDALSTIRVLDADETTGDIDTTLVDLSKRVLNRLLKSWNMHGIHLWKLEEAEFTTAQGTQSYIMSAFVTSTASKAIAHRPLRISQVRCSVDGSSQQVFEMKQMARDEYYRLPDRTTQGTPSNWFYDPNRGHGQGESGALYIWPTSDDSANEIQVTYEREIEDADSTANTIDIPSEWSKALVLALASDLAPHLGINLNEQTVVAARAKAELERALDFDRDTAPTYFVNEGGWGY